MKEEDNAAPPRQSRLYGLRLVILVAFASFAVAILGLALFANIMERKDEARNPFFRVVELTDDTADPAVWGQNFPLQYDGYLRTVDQVRTRYGGSEAVPRTPTDADPRSVVAQSRLEADPRLKTVWDGYAFAVDFREERGHAYMLEDQTFTERQIVAQQPGTCINCHASVYNAYKRLGDGDIVRGFRELNKLPYAEARKEVTHSVACIDCHDSQTMQLRVTRPAFMAGIKLAKAREGIEDYDVNRDATRLEMRTYVCGQCHVEYYFKGPEKELTYPWHEGLRVENMLEYYEEVGHNDWVHARTGAGVLKAQHPEFELYNQGIHARAGVSCADCHMPYDRQGAMKISSHHVRSPLLSLNASCQTCHKGTEDELRSRVEAIQERTYKLRNIALDALVELIEDIAAARDAGATDEQLASARKNQRNAQFFVDFVEAENSMGFHAPAEAARILGESINYSRLGQVSLRDVPFAAQTATLEASK